MSNANFNTELLTSTLQRWVGGLSDVIYESNVVFKYLKENNSVVGVDPWKVKQNQAGGRSFVVPLRYAKSGNAQWYSGWGQLNEVPTNNWTAAEFNIRQLSNWIGINGLEQWQNAGDEQMIDMMNERGEDAKLELMDKINTAIYAVSDGSSLDGFGGSAGASSNSSLIASDGVGTIGNIVSGTDTWWKNKFGTAASFAANGYSTMKTLYNDCSVGTDAPNFIVTDQTNFERYETIPEARESFVKVNADGKSINVGYPALSFKTIPIFFDRACTTNKMYMLNTRHLFLWQCKGKELSASPFVPVYSNGQDGIVSRIFWYGNLVCNDRRKLGVMNITAA